MKNWVKASEVELFEQIENSNKEIEISYTSDEFNEFVYLVKIKKEDEKNKTIKELSIDILENLESKISDLLSESQNKIVNELNSRLLSWKEKYNEELNNIKQQINDLNEKIENFKAPVVEQIDYSPYFKDFSKKIDIVAKRLIKMETTVNEDSIKLKKIINLPEIKKEIKLQQKVAKAISKTTLN